MASATTEPSLVEYRDDNGDGWHTYSVVRTGRTEGDLSYDRKLDVRDVDIVANNVALGSTDVRLDLNKDDVVDVADLHFLVRDLMSTFVGDANLDSETSQTFSPWRMASIGEGPGKT